MAHYATARFNYWGQLGILTTFIGGGLIIGGLASFIPLMHKINFSDITSGSTTQLMEKLLLPENANPLRISQFLTTLFLFFLPSVLYAFVCHKKAFTHLGFRRSIDPLEVSLMILIMLACLPIVGAIQELTEMLPWSKALLAQFKTAEDAYNKQIAVIARMNSFGEYLVAVVVIALLPAVFEETLFRGAMQNLFSRWFKMPILAIIVTAFIFSAVHGSYLGFLSRFALGFVLGWVYYRTGNIWLNIIGHFVNNAVAISVLYIFTKPGQLTNPSVIDEHFPLWIGIVSIAAVVVLLMVFERVAKKHIDRPGAEVLLPGYNFSDNPFTNDTASTKQP